MLRNRMERWGWAAGKIPEDETANAEEENYAAVESCVTFGNGENVGLNPQIHEHSTADRGVLVSRTERWSWKSAKSQEEVETVDESYSMESSVVLSSSEIMALDPQLLRSSVDRVQVYDGDTSSVMSPRVRRNNSRSESGANSWLNDDGRALDKENGFSTISADVITSSPSSKIAPSLFNLRNSADRENVNATGRSLSSPLTEASPNSPSKTSNTRSNTTATSVADNRFSVEDATMPSPIDILQVEASNTENSSAPLSERSQASKTPSTYSRDEVQMFDENKKKLLNEESQKFLPSFETLKHETTSQAIKIAPTSAWNHTSTKLCPDSSSLVPASESSASQEEKNESVHEVDDEHTFARAYDVWRRKGLMKGENKSSSRVIRRYAVFDDSLDKKLQSRTIERKVENISGRLSLPAASSLVEVEGENFANILKQWKNISDDKPCAHFLSPVNAIPAQEEKQRLSISRSKPRTEKKTTRVIEVAFQNAADSIPALRLQDSFTSHNTVTIRPNVQPNDSAMSPMRRAPKSQAWKLKMVREQRTQETQNTSRHQGFYEKRKITRESMAASKASRFRQFRSPPKSHGDYKSAIQEFLRDVDGTAQKCRAKSAPRPLRQNEPMQTLPVELATVVEPLILLDVVANSLAPAANGECSNYKRSQSLPRLRSQRSDSSLSVIRTRLKQERESMRQSLASSSPNALGTSIGATPVNSFSNKAASGHMNVRRGPALVKDLVIDNNNNDGKGYDDIPQEVQIATTASSKSNMFSPYTERVMRNLEKVYNENDKVQTPRGAAYSDRPWQHDVLIRRVDSLTDDAPMSDCHCSCSNSVFVGNDDMIEFFLPLMGEACSCGKKQPGLVNSEEPTSLVNILRPWQVAFLGVFGIYRGEELVKANHRSGATLASALRQYRKREGMTPFRTTSCVTALQIWSKTSKAFVRSIRNQAKKVPPELGRLPQLKAPNTLYILSSFLDKMPNDGEHISSSTTASSSPCSRTSFGNSTITPSTGCKEMSL